MIKTVSLTADTETKVEISGGYNVGVINRTTGMLYASRKSGIVAGADDVAAIPAGDSYVIRAADDTVYLLATAAGDVQLESIGAKEVFKIAAARSSSGGGEGGGTVDDVARQAISSHANNEEIHLTAEEREAWNDVLNASAVVTGVGLGFAANQTVTVEEFIEALAAKFGNEKIVLSRVAWATFDSITITDGATSISFNGGFITGMVCSTDKAWHNTRLMYCQGDGGDNNDVYLIRGYATDDVVESNYTITKINDGGNADTLGDYHASDFALKSEYDALAARVAALESGA